MALSKEAVDAIKKELNYKDGAICCKSCTHFVPTDCSGSHNAQQSHCIVLVALEFPCREDGWCKKHNPKNP